MDQEYFICGLCKWCFNAKYWRNTEFNFFLVELFLKEAFVFIGQT